MMIIPLDLLVDFNKNPYSMSAATIKRAIQIHLTGDEDLEESRGKVVSTALKQLLTEKVVYRLEG